MKNLFDTYKQHYKALLLLGLPIVVGQLGVIVLGFADTLMIGHHSTEELGAASFVNNLFTLCIIFSTGFSYGLTPVVGGFYGNRRFAEAGQALRCSLVANVLVALLLTLVMAVLYFNVERLGQPGELLPLIKPYYLVLLASLVFVMLFNGFKQFTDGITDTKTAMWILLGGNALNIVGNYTYQWKAGLSGDGTAWCGYQHLVLPHCDGGGLCGDCASRPPVYPLQARLHAAGVVNADVQEAQCTGLARGYADGYGDRFLQSERRHGGLAGDSRIGIAPDYVDYLPVYLYDVLRYGGGGCRACQ